MDDGLEVKVLRGVVATQANREAERERTAKRSG
jgi:hypothetical protein